MDTILEILETIKPGANFAASTDFIEEHLSLIHISEPTRRS